MASVHDATESICIRHEVIIQTSIPCGSVRHQAAIVRQQWPSLRCDLGYEERGEAGRQFGSISTKPRSGQGDPRDGGNQSYQVDAGSALHRRQRSGLGTPFPAPAATDVTTCLVSLRTCALSLCEEYGEQFREMKHEEKRQCPSQINPTQKVTP